MDKNATGFTALTDGQTNDDAKIVVMAHPTTGELYRPTLAQVKKSVSTKKFKYVATGSEGTTLTIPDIAAMEILSIAREGSTMYEVGATPDTVEFIWDDTDITLGLATSAGERFLILYKNY